MSSMPAIIDQSIIVWSDIEFAYMGLWMKTLYVENAMVNYCACIRVKMDVSVCDYASVTTVYTEKNTFTYCHNDDIIILLLYY